MMKLQALSLVSYQAIAYPGFRSMKQLGVFPLPPNRTLVHCAQCYPRC